VYQPAEHLLWDAWFAFDGERHHAYYLQAPKTLADPEQRHGLAELGHAVSRDLRSWEERPTAFRRAPAPAWDDRAVWSGSVLVLDRVAHLFYTATSLAEGGVVQRIGHAVSANFDTFVRTRPVPTLELDARWYEWEGGPYGHVHWRDPFAIVDGGRLHLFLTARAPAGTWDERGVIALATSDDWASWAVHPPVTEPGEFWMLEVPQILCRRGRWWLLASTAADWHAQRRQDRLAGVPRHGGLVVYVADRLTGPYRPASDAFFLGDEQGTYYTAKVIPTADGDRLVASRFYDDGGSFLGALSNPAPVSWYDDGPHLDLGQLWDEAPGR
jgi:beta-fructofuranosidase